MDSLPWWGWVLVGAIAAPFLFWTVGSIIDVIKELREERKWQK